MSEVWKTEAGRTAVLARYRELLANWPDGGEQRLIPTVQGETFVVSSGPPDAPAVILLHGSAANAGSWMGDAAVLNRHFRVHAVDMIGEPGLSAPARPPLASGVYAPWLAEVLDGLGVRQATLVGISLGGWLALHFASARPERVTALAVLCPGGVGRQKNILLWAIPLLMLGGWGRRRVMDRIRGPVSSGEPSPADATFGAFMQTIFAHCRPRTETLPAITDAELARLSMPLFVILGARDVLIDSADTRARFESAAPNAEILWLADAGHMLMGYGARIAAFFRRAAER